MEPPRHTPDISGRQRLLLFAAAYCVVWIAAWYAAAVLASLGNVSLWFLPAGLRFFCLLMLGLRGLAVEAATQTVWVIVQFATGGVSIADPASAQFAWQIYGWYVCMAANALVALPLHHVMRDRWDFARPRDVALFLSAALVASALAATAGSYRLVALDIVAASRWVEVFGCWTTGDFIGIITLTPLLIIRMGPNLQRYLARGTWGRMRHAIDNEHRLSDTHTLLIALASLLLLTGVSKLASMQAHFPIAALLLLLPLTGIALRSGLGSAALAAVALDAGLVLLIARRATPEQALQYQLVMIAIALVGLWLGGAVEARNRLIARFREEVDERTRSLRETVSELATKEQHLQVLLAGAPVGLLEFDETGCCRYINANGCALTGCSPEQATGRSLLDFVAPEDRDYVDFVWNVNRQSPEVKWLEFRTNCAGQRCVAHWINLIQTDQPHRGTIVVLTDATARDQQNQRLWTLAHHDPLTGLPNRNMFSDRVDQALRQAKRKNREVALLWLDLDGFKAINDTLGHAAGDALLKGVAERLNSRARASDTVARLGGDEFAVVMADTLGGDGATRMAQDLVASLAEPFDLPQGRVRISASVGVALYPQHAANAETLAQRADMALYSSKQAGKNQVRLWTG